MVFIMNLSRIGKFILLMVFLNCIQTSDGSIHERDLLSTLFRDYSPNVRPRVNYSTPLNVEINFTLYQIRDLNERLGSLYFVGYFDSKWSDDYLQWNSSKFGGIQNIVLPPAKIWLPDFCLSNSVESVYEDEYFQYFRVNLFSNGDVLWSFGGSLATICSVDITFYPFDTQRCSITIQNNAFTRELIDFAKDTNRFFAENYTSNGFWDIGKAYVERHELVRTSRKGKYYARVTFTLELKRKAKYQILTVMIPCSFLIFLSLLIFWLPPDSGEKMSLGMTILLSLCVLHFTLAGIIPENSDCISVLDVFLIFMLGVSCYSVAVNIVVLFLHHKDSSTPVPKWITVIALNCIGRVFCISRRNSLDERSGEKIPNIAYNVKCPTEIERASSDGNIQLCNRNRCTMDTAEVQCMLSDIRRLTRKLDESEKKNKVLNDWKDLARVLDRISFLFVLSVTIFGAVWFWIQINKAQAMNFA